MSQSKRRIAPNTAFCGWMPSFVTRRGKRLQTCVAATVLLVGASAVQSQVASDALGGTHAVGVTSGYSPVSGPIWGYDENVRYSPTVLRYSYRFLERRHFAVRYAPEITAVAMLYEPAPSLTNPAAPVRHFGAGASPVGFEVTFRQGQRVQPFAGTHGGFVYFADRVLSPQGSQWMYTIDFGGGASLFFSPKNAVELGYRYQHLSNANISMHNPGTDADTFTVGFAHFWGR